MSTSKKNRSATNSRQRKKRAAMRQATGSANAGTDYYHQIAGSGNMQSLYGPSFAFDYLSERDIGDDTSQEQWEDRYFREQIPKIVLELRNTNVMITEEILIQRFIDSGVLEQTEEGFAFTERARLEGYRVDMLYGTVTLGTARNHADREGEATNNESLNEVQRFCRAKLSQYLSQSSNEDRPRTLQAFMSILLRQSVLTLEGNIVHIRYLRATDPNTPIDFYALHQLPGGGVPTNRRNEQSEFLVEFADLQFKTDDGHILTRAPGPGDKFSFDQGQTWQEVYSPSVALDINENIFFVRFLIGTSS